MSLESIDDGGHDRKLTICWEEEPRASVIDQARDGVAPTGGTTDWQRFRIPFALDADGVVIVPDEGVRGGAYQCPECKERVVFRAGRQTSKHFAHYRMPESCGLTGEGWLHLAAKHAIAGAVRRWLAGRAPPPCVVGGTCRACGDDRSQALPEVVRDVALEHWAPELAVRADVALLDAAGNPVWLVEVRASHAVDEAKIVRLRAMPMVEVDAGEVLMHPTRWRAIAACNLPPVPCRCHAHLSAVAQRIAAWREGAAEAPRLMGWSCGSGEPCEDDLAPFVVSAELVDDSSSAGLVSLRLLNADSLCVGTATTVEPRSEYEGLELASPLVEVTLHERDGSPLALPAEGLLLHHRSRLRCTSCERHEAEAPTWRTLPAARLVAATRAWLAGASPPPLLARRCKGCGVSRAQPLPQRIAGARPVFHLGDGRVADVALTDSSGMPICLVFFATSLSQGETVHRATDDDLRAAWARALPRERAVGVEIAVRRSENTDRQLVLDVAASRGMRPFDCACLDLIPF